MPDVAAMTPNQSSRAGRAGTAPWRFGGTKPIGRGRSAATPRFRHGETAPHIGLKLSQFPAIFTAYQGIPGSTPILPPQAADDSRFKRHHAPIGRRNSMTGRALARRLLVALCVATLAPLGAAAQSAGRVITIVVPYTPGTGPDILARVIGDEYQSRLHQPVMIDNKPGASGNIGTQFVARAAPDGLTLLMTSSPFTQNLALMKNVPYDPIKNFAPIIECGIGVVALVVHPSVPVKSTAEFVAYARARPGQLDYASPGYGTPHHLAMELFKLASGTDLKHIPYKGTAGAVQDLVGGHVSAMFLPIHVSLPLVQGHEIRILAVANDTRLAAAPDVPTLDESGLHVDLDYWFGMLAPAGTPREIVARFNTLTNEILNDPPITAKLAVQGLTIIGGPPERFADLIAREMVKWEKLLRAAGIAAE
jgi:tripartite-type tricarboxylate transporter receptor subunit TctC